MFLRKYWLPLSVCLVAIVGVGIYLLAIQPPPEPIVTYTPVEPLAKPTEKPKTETPVVEEAEQPQQGGHTHADGTFHEAPHSIPADATTTPDFPAADPNGDPVEAAYQRLEYIKNNPYAWGGVHSPRATQLIAELLPASYPIDHNDGDARQLLIEELCEQNDPRAAEALIAIMCDGGTKGRVMFDTLEAIGPPAVPYILPYLEREDTKGSAWIYVGSGVFDSLSRIGVRYRDDLGGILDHIIIPKFQEIAADKNNERYGRSTIIRAREALSLLQ